MTTTTTDTATQNHILEIATVAIHQRLCGWGNAREAIIGITPNEDGSYILRLNSGGNAIPSRNALCLSGYRSEFAPEDGEYGAAIIVIPTPKTPPAPRL